MALNCFIYFLVTVITMVSGMEISGSQYKPIITDCSVKSSGFNHTVTLHWTLVNKLDYIDIREYWIYCNCSDYETDYTKNKISGLCRERCFQHSFSLPVDTCIDKCSCLVYGRPRWYPYNPNYWSESCNFTVGPLAPHAAPHISKPVAKMNKQRSVCVFFELPKPLQKLYCDVDYVKALSVNVTQESGESCYQVIDGNDIKKIKYYSYEFTFQFDNCPNLDFWSPANLSIAAHNSKEASPFSSPYTVRGAINSDIESRSYKLQIENVTNSSASFFWKLKDPLPSMLEWGFIKGSQYNLTLFDGTFIKENVTKDITFTLSDLTPGKKYLICVTLITTDTNSWPPWPSCMNFMTTQGLLDDLTDDYKGDNNTNIFWFLFTAVLGFFIVIVLISVLCLKPYCPKSSGMGTTAERNSIAEEIMQMSSHVPTIPPFGPSDSDIESLTPVATSNESDASSFQGVYVQIKDNISDNHSVT